MNALSFAIAVAAVFAGVWAHELLNPPPAQVCPAFAPFDYQAPDAAPQRSGDGA